MSTDTEVGREKRRGWDRVQYNHRKPPAQLSRVQEPQGETTWIWKERDGIWPGLSLKHPVG